MNYKMVIALVLLMLLFFSADSQWRIIAVADTDAKNKYQHEAAQQLYQDAISAYYKHNHGRAAALFKEFANRYPSHPMTDKAYLWIKFIDTSQTQSRESTDAPESLYNQAITAYYRKNHQEALALFNEFTRLYPYHSMRGKAYNWISYIERNLKTDAGDREVAKTLYNRALNAYYKQGSTGQAFALLNAVIQQYPTSEFAAKAKDWIAYLNKHKPDNAPVAIAKTQGYSVAKPEPKPAKEKEVYEAEKLYQRGFNAYKQKKYKEATSVLSIFLENYPKHQMADRATYWIGECFYAQNNFYDAINTFKEVVIKYSSSAKAADSLLMIGNAYLSLNDLPNARSSFERVIKNHASTSAAETARRKLEQFKDKEKPPSSVEDKLQVDRRRKNYIY